MLEDNFYNLTVFEDQNLLPDIFSQNNFFPFFPNNEDNEISTIDLINKTIEKKENKENKICLPEFYSLFKIVNECIKDKKIKDKLNEGKSIIHLSQYKFLEKGNKKGLKKKFKSKNEEKEENKERKKRGKKIKVKRNNHIIHSKMSFDNMTRKMKSSLINKFILNFLNNIINLKIKNIKLIKIDYKFINVFTKNKELNNLQKTLQDLYSQDITKKNNKFKSDYNKTIIKEIIDKDDTINFVFKLTYKDFIDLFTRKKTIEDIINFKNIKSDINIEEIKIYIPKVEEFFCDLLEDNDLEYSTFVLFYLFNFERALNLKQERVKQKNLKFNI